MAAAILAASGCTTEVHPVGQPQVRVERENRQVVASWKVLRDGEQVASLRTLQVQGRTRSRTLHEVRDLHSNTLGYIDERNCAFRMGAHTGSEFVSSSSDQRRNVAAILGAYGANIEVVEDVPAAMMEKSSDSRRAPGR